MSISLLVLSTLSSARGADYTGDGIDDLAIGVPDEDFSTGAGDAGGVAVLRGSTSSGLTDVGDVFVHQDTSGVPGSNEDDEQFGFAIGAGDVDGDGRDDLIAGADFAMIGGAGAGAFWRVELSPTSSSMSVTSSQQFSQFTTGVSGTAEWIDRFGASITVADFDGDGYDDVVVGIPGEPVVSGSTYVDLAGAITFLPGSSGGVTAGGQVYYTQDSAYVADSAEDLDGWGTSLEAGDFDGDGYADLAIGDPFENIAGGNEGIVQVMYGTSTGPGVVSPDDEIWSPGEGSAAGTRETGSFCGQGLAVGDFDDDGYDDLAIGCYEYTLPSAMWAGAVLVVYGSSGGLADSEMWSQDTSGVSGTAEELDHFGWALTSGDYDGDGYDDLAIGAPREDYSYEESGVVQVLFGSSSGLTATDNLLLAQDTGSTVAGTPAAFDHFGYSLASGDWNDDGRDDLAVGSPYDDEGGGTEAGVVNVFYGSSSGPSTSGDELFSQDTSSVIAGIDDTSEAYDHFGYALR